MAGLVLLRDGAPRRSTAERCGLHSHAERGNEKKYAKQLINSIYSILRKYSLYPNVTKTNVIPPGARKVVLGLIVDRNIPRLSKEFKKNLEYHLWAISKFGIFEHYKHNGFSSVFGYLNHIRGLISHAMNIEIQYGTKLRKVFTDELVKQNLVDFI